MAVIGVSVLEYFGLVDANSAFPPYRGGILRYADKWGLENVNRTLLDLEKRYGPAFSPAGMIKEMAEKGKTFYQE